MAKFEEADPRWKVKELGDQGKNVNGWCVRHPRVNARARVRLHQSRAFSISVLHVDS